MTSLRNEKLRGYYSVGPAAYNVVRSLSFWQEANDIGEMEQRLELALSKDVDAQAEKLMCMRFLGVRRLRIAQPEWSLVSIPLLEIRLGEEVLEGWGDFFASDASQDAFLSFFCRDFEVIVTTTA